MIIRRLDIEGFGRFRDRDLELAPGLNLLFGPNEAGKSTLHAFLDAMLFGFRQTHTAQGRQRRTRAYTAERERHRPWDGGPYAGSLTYAHEGRIYQVRRDFAQDELTVRDALTGRDLTATFGLDPATGERDFARRHGGMTPVVFRGTLSVGQGTAAVGEGALAAEIRGILTQAEAPADGPGAGALETLRTAAEHIGTPRRLGTPLGQANSRVSDLEARREIALSALQRTRELEDLEQRLEAAQAAATAAKSERDRLERARAGARLAEALALQTEIDALPPFPTTRLDELGSRQRAVQEAERAAAAAARQEAADLRQRAAEATTRRRRLLELGAIADDTVARAQRLEAAAQPGAARVLALAGLLGLVAGILAHALWLAAAGAVAAAAGIWPLLAARRAALALSRLLASAGADGVRTLASLDDERRVLRAQPDADPDALLREAAQLEAAVPAGVPAVAQARTDLAAYLAAHGVASPEAFAARVEAADRRQHLQARLDGLLSGTSLEELAARFPGGPPAADRPPAEREVEEAHTAWLNAMAAATRLTEQAAALRQQLGPAPPSLGAVEADLRGALAERRRLEVRRQALDLAAATIEAERQAVQREFAPVLHRRLGELAPALTAARYAEIHVDEDLNVTVRVPGRSDLVPAAMLSRGAADQIHLAARLALAEVATGGAEAPLLLDESLAHYDDDRLAAALACLGELATSRQILLFSCHNRVAAGLRDIPHHLVAV